MKRILKVTGATFFVFCLVYLGLQTFYSRIWAIRFGFPGIEYNFSYKEIPKVVETKRREFLKLHEPNRSLKVKEFWMKFLDKVVFPAWKGTLWRFYGTADRPHPGLLFSNRWVSHFILYRPPQF